MLDGNWGFGPVIATRAVELAIQKAQQTDISSVAVSRCNEVGRLGGYACLAADAEMIGLLMANDHGGGACVAPYGGVERRLSTNPIACAVPIDRHDPIVLDMSTSVVASGKIRVKQHRNEAVPKGWLIDAEGESTTDASDFYGVLPAALLPFGGVAAHKGFGLSVIVDILAGALTGAGCSKGEDARVGNGLFVLVINVASFREFPGFSAEVERFIGYINQRSALPVLMRFGCRGNAVGRNNASENGRYPDRCRDVAANSGTSITAVSSFKHLENTEQTPS